MHEGGNQTLLVEQAIAGEPGALSRLLMDSYPALVSRLDQRLPADLRGYIAPEDIVQETYAEAFRRVASFRPQGPDAFHRWLTAIADSRLIDAIRAQRAAK